MARSSKGVLAVFAAALLLAQLCSLAFTTVPPTSRRPAPRQTVALQSRGGQVASKPSLHELDANLGADLRHELDKILVNAGSKRFLVDVLNRIDTPQNLIRFWHKYTTFNGDFAGGAASLAGAFHVRRDLFRDPKEPISACSDRSAEIASHIFFATEDEYATREGSRLTHRRLGQILLSETVKFYGSPILHEARWGEEYEMNDILMKVIEGYRVNRAHTAEDLFFALGWHLGSELLADEEFNLMDDFMKSKFPELVAHLSSTVVPEAGVVAYHWIKVHTYVEEEHFSHGLDAATRAIDSYSGPHSKVQVHEMILDGFRAFADFQQEFFGSILSSHTELVERRA